MLACLPVLRIGDVYPGSEFFSIQVANISHPRSASKNFSISTQKWFLRSRKDDPGCSSRIRILIFYPSRIQGNKGTGSRIQIYNTVACFDCFDGLKVLECLFCDIYRNHRKWVDRFFLKFFLVTLYCISFSAGAE
jgi:hypothetical protein